MILLKSIILESQDSWLDRYYEVIEKMEQEWWSGKKHQSWRLVPARLLKLTWLTFAKYGRVNEKALDKIWEIIEENVIKIGINSDIRDGHNPEFFGKDSYDEITEKEWDRFFEFTSDNSGTTYGRGPDPSGGHSRYSDGAQHLYKLAEKVGSSNTPEEKLIAVDRILNFIHGIGPMAKWFVEGGTQSLEDISDAPVKGIHLTGRLTEKKLDLSNKEDAAEHIIRQVWRFIPPGEDRYDINDVLLWLANEFELSQEANKIAQQFYPDDPEPLYKFHDDIERVLQKIEVKRLEKRKKATPSLKDPIYLLKKLMVKRSWDGVKKAIAKTLPGRVEGYISDEDANHVFQRLYKNAMGETVYNIEEIMTWGYGRLSDLADKETSSQEKQYTVNFFIRHYFGGKTPHGKVRVWRGTNNPHSPIRPGDFVTFDRGYSQGYMSGKWKAVVTDLIDAKDLYLYKADIGMSELIYWPEGHKIKKYEGEVPTLQDFWQEHRFGI